MWTKAGVTNLIITLLKAKEDESQLVSTYGASMKSTLVESSSSQPSPGQYFDEQKNMSLPPHLLKSTIETNRNYSPVARYVVTVYWIRIKNLEKTPFYIIYILVHKSKESILMKNSKTMMKPTPINQL